MEMTFSHLLPGLAGFAAAVVTPWYSADSGVIRNAIVPLFSFILLGVAIAVFLRSIKQKGKQASKQSHAKESQMLQTLEQAIEKGRAGLDLNVNLDVAASPIAHEEISSPLAELALQFEKALPEPMPDPKIDHDRIERSALNDANGANDNGIAHPPPNPARPETAHAEIARVSLPRLSELRGMRFSQALRELDKAKRTAPANAGPVSLRGSLNDALAYGHNDPLNDALNDSINDPINETLMSAIAPFEPMFASAPSAPQARNSAAAMHENGVAATKDTGAQRSPSQQTIFPTKPSLPAKSRGHREEDSERSPREPKGPGKETNSFLDQLHILPSRRGQYKKKG
jgi:hypothetical protein